MGAGPSPPGAKVTPGICSPSPPGFAGGDPHARWGVTRCVWLSCASIRVLGTPCMATYWALVGPEGTNPSLWPDARQAKRAVREGLVTAAEVNPRSGPDIEMVLVHLEVATEFFVDYFRIDGEPWTAQFRPVSTVETV